MGKSESIRISPHRSCLTRMSQHGRHDLQLVIISFSIYYICLWARYKMREYLPFVCWKLRLMVLEIITISTLRLGTK